MNLLEKCVVTQDFCDRKDTYNINVGGDGGWSYVNSEIGPYKKGSNKRHNAIILANKNRDLQQQANKCKEAFNQKKQNGQFVDFQLNVSKGLKKYKQLHPEWLVGENNPFYGKKHTTESKNKMSNHAKEHNSMSGKIWICNLDLEESKIWDANLPIPDGWIKGRHSKQNFIKIKQKLQKLQEEYELNCKQLNIDNLCKDTDIRYEDLVLKNNQNKQLIKDLEKQYRIYQQQIKQQQFKQQQLDKLKLLYEMYKEFIVNEFDGVVKKFDYKYTRNNLIMAFKAHIPEYVPQKCNRWKNRNKIT